MPTTAGERVKAAVRKQRTTLAAVAREAQVPAPWLRSFATDHVHRGDPARIKRVAEALGLDYRELLALTDQLGAVETLEASHAPASAAGLPELLQALERQSRAIEEQTAAINALVERFADPSETAEVVGRVVLALLQANGALAASPARSASPALPAGPE